MEGRGREKWSRGGKKWCVSVSRNVKLTPFERIVIYEMIASGTDHKDCPGRIADECLSKHRTGFLLGLEGRG